MDEWIPLKADEALKATRDERPDQAITNEQKRRKRKEKESEMEMGEKVVRSSKTGRQWTMEGDVDVAGGRWR